MIKKWTHFSFFISHNSNNEIIRNNWNCALQPLLWKRHFFNINNQHCYFKSVFLTTTDENTADLRSRQLDHLGRRINIASGPEASSDRDCYKTHRLSIMDFFFFLLLLSTASKDRRPQCWWWWWCRKKKEEREGGGRVSVYKSMPHQGIKVTQLH